MVIVYYPNVMLASDAARRIISAESLVSTDSYDCVSVPSDWAVSPAYAVGWDADKKLYIGVAEYGADQNGTCYGGIILPRPVDSIQWLALVVDVIKPGYSTYKREVWELEYDSTNGAYMIKNAYDAPAILEFMDSDNNVILSMPLGIAPLVLVAIMVVGAAVGAAAYKFFSWKEQEAKARAVNYLAQICDNDPAACHAAIAGVAADNAISDTDGWLDKIKDYVLGGFAAIVGIILLVMKWKVILDVFRSMFRR